MQFELKKSLNLDLKNTGTTLLLEKHWDYLIGFVLDLWCIGFGLEKYSDYLTGLGIILYVGIGIEKYLNYVTGFGLTLSVYDILDFDLRNTHHHHYLTRLGLILLNTGLGLINQAGILLQKYEDFLESTVFYFLMLC